MALKEGDFLKDIWAIRSDGKKFFHTRERKETKKGYIASTSRTIPITFRASQKSN